MKRIIASFQVTYDNGSHMGRDVRISADMSKEAIEEALKEFDMLQHELKTALEIFEDTVQKKT